MLDQLRALVVFAETVETGSFREAARRLGVSPSVASYHVSQLEKKLGRTLLHRSTRRLSLTADGEELFATAREMLAVGKRGLDAVAQRGGKPVGRLRVTAPALLAETRFCEHVAAFARENPRVNLSIDFSERRSDLVAKGFDLALRIGRLEDSSLKARRLAEMSRCLVGSPGYVSERAAAMAPSDLRAWEWIHLAPVLPQCVLVGAGKQSVTLDYRPRIVVDSVTAMRNMALAGLGIAQLPDVLTRHEIGSGRLVEVMPRWRLPGVTVFAVWPASTTQPVMTKFFIDAIAPALKTLFASGQA